MPRPSGKKCGRAAPQLRGNSSRMDISQPSLAKLEKPDANPRKSTLKKVADALGIELGQLDI